MARPSASDQAPALRLAEGTPVVLSAPNLVAGVGGRVAASRPGCSVEITVTDPDAAALGALVAGTRVEVRFACRHDAGYRFTAGIVATRLTDGQHRVLVGWPSSVQRHQARENVRVPLTVAIALVRAGPRRLSDGGTSWVHGTVVDLSAGGVGVVIGERFPVGQALLVRLDVPGRHADVHVHARARVVRGVPLPSRNELYHYGIELLDLSARVEQEIVCAVFHQLASRLR